MKQLILALALLVAPLGASARTPDEQCAVVASMVLFAAQGRDLGSHPEDVYNGLLADGIPAEMAMSIVATVFFTRPDVHPNDLAMSFFNYCTSEAL